MSHTPGPWTLELDHNDQQCVYAGECFIAILPHQCVASIEAQQEINARLIAAAPDLLAALKTVAASFEMTGNRAWDPEREIVRTAIAKAEGR